MTATTLNPNLPAAELLARITDGRGYVETHMQERFTLREAQAIIGTLDDPAAARSELIDWLASLGEKLDDVFVMNDYRENGAVSSALAVEWATHQPRGFEFLDDMVERSRGRGLSVGQVRGVLNCLRAFAVREARAMAEAEPFGDPEEEIAKQAETPSAGEFLPLVERLAHFSLSKKQRAALDAGEIHGAMQVARGGKIAITVDGLDVVASLAGSYSRLPGTVNVTSQRTYGGEWYGRISVDGTADRRLAQNARVIAALRKLMADPEAALASYGRAHGECGICGRRLDNDESIKRGVGPICAERWGIE